MYKLVLSNIEKKIKDSSILKNISFKAESGKVVSLLGPSGCGKTTTLKIIAGLLHPDHGDVLLNDQSILQVPVERRGTVIVFQDHLLFPHLNVEENISFGLKMAGKSKSYRSKKVEEMLQLVKLPGINKKFPHQLSGGQRQRIALARALAVEPKVLLLDEPFSSLDTKLRMEMRELTFSLVRKLNMTTILVTHDTEEAFMYSDKIAIMLNGEVKQFGTPEELYLNPNSVEVANFLGEKNYIKGVVKGGQFISSIFTLAIDKEDDDQAVAMIKPEDIKMYPKGEKELQGEILESQYAGERIFYKVRILNEELKAMTLSTEIWSKGDIVSIQFMEKNIRIFSDEGREWKD